MEDWLEESTQPAYSVKVSANSAASGFSVFPELHLLPMLDHGLKSLEDVFFSWYI